uniref:Uncharacterized protein n=1 Tax=Solanum lycopersicum TaxID=4081 RepID=A0A3Q7GEG3_SOLLC
MANNFRKGLHALTLNVRSFVACTDRLGEDIDKWKIKLSKTAVAFEHWLEDNEIACIGYGCPHCSVDIFCGLSASVVSCAHRTVIAGYGLCASSRGIQPWSERGDMSCVLCASNKQHKQTTCNKTLHTSIMACVHRLDDSSRGLCASTWRHH